MESVLTKSQHKSETRFYTKSNQQYRIIVTIRYDDECGNGRNTFAITGDIDRKTRGGWANDSCGCIHDDIAKRFPKLAHLIKWHLCSSDGPMHYVANTIYLAGDRDHNGLKKNEHKQIRNGRTGKPCWILESSECPKYVDSDEKPADPPTLHYVSWDRVGEGKERQFDSARSTAIWPEATDEMLGQNCDTLKAALRERLPALIESFRKDIEAIAFKW